MVYYRESQIDDAFFALSHPVRRGVLEHLADGDASVGDVSTAFRESPSQMTKHLLILERARLIKRTKEGRIHRLHLESGPLKEASDWIMKYRRFWETQLDSLDRYLHKLEDSDSRNAD